MVPAFKSIVLFGHGFAFAAGLREYFSSIPFIKIFETINVDEVDQILKQSEQTAVFVEDPGLLTELTVLERIQDKKARFKLYFLDAEARVPPQEIERLSSHRITTLVAHTSEDLRKKLALYLLGKIELARYVRLDETAEIERGRKRKSYFSHFKLVGEHWEIVASTHEQDPEIEDRLGQSWSLYCQRLLARAQAIHTPEEDDHFSQEYFCLIWPHQRASSRFLSIIHLRKDPLFFDSLKNKALQFLRTL